MLPKRENSATLQNAEFAYLQPLCCIFFVKMINYIYELQKWLKNALFWRIFVGTAKIHQNRACYISTTVDIVVYKVSGSHLQHHSTTTPPIAVEEWHPTSTKNFYFFLRKTRWWRVSKKTKLFLFIYFSFYNIYNIIYKYFLLF